MNKVTIFTKKIAKPLLTKALFFYLPLIMFTLISGFHVYKNIESETQRYEANLPSEDIRTHNQDEKLDQALNWTIILSPLIPIPPLIILLYVTYISSRAYQKEHASAKKANKLLEDAIDSTKNGFIFYNEDGSLLRINKQATDFLSESDNIDTLNNFLALMYDNAAVVDYDTIGNASLSVSGKQAIYHFKEIVSLKNCPLCLIQIQNTRLGGAVVVMSDISEFSKLENDLLQLTQENHKLISAIEATNMGICISDSQKEDLPILFANQAFSRYSNFSNYDLVNTSFKTVIKAQTNSEESENFIKKISTKQEASFEFEKKNNIVSRWYEMKVTRSRNRTGTGDLIITFLSDVTQNKIKEGQFVQAQKLEALGQVAGGVAHDFNNVLSIVDGYSRMIAKQCNNEKIDGETIKNQVERVQLAAQRGASLTKQLLTFGRHKIKEESICNISNAIEVNKSLLTPLIDASIKLEININSENLCVSCSEDTISQILMNLVINARDAIDEDGGTITINLDEISYEKIIARKPSYMKEGRYVRLSITDNGSGIDEQTLRKIFDPFFTTKDQGQGTGLGLSMIYGIVQQLKGMIDVKSEIGEGTNMIIYLPITDKEPSQQIIGDLGDLKNLKLKGYTALVAEDEPDLRALITNMLEELDLNVMTAKDGNEALMLQDEFDDKIDFLITDIVMPELGGAKLAELFREIRPETSIIFMSGYPSKGQLAKAEIPQDIPFIAKPVKYDVLAQLLHDKVVSNGSKKGPIANSNDTWETSVKNTQSK